MGFLFSWFKVTESSDTSGRLGTGMEVLLLFLLRVVIFLGAMYGLVWFLTLLVSLWEH